jgi:hypothetical protein
MIDKTQLTEKLLGQLGLATDSTTVKKYLHLWWQNPRKSKSNSFRLTSEGLDFFINKLELAKYKIDIPEDTFWNNQLFLRLDKFIESPYYIDKKSITVFREKTAVELILFSGDIQKYGLAKAMSLKNNSEKSS